MKHQELSWRVNVCDRIKSQIEQLTQPWTEHVSQRVQTCGADGVWRTDIKVQSIPQPPLLNQLEQTDRAGAQALTMSVPTSKPPMPLFGLDLAKQIETEARQWVHALIPSWRPQSIRQYLTVLADDPDTSRMTAGINIAASRLTARCPALLHRLATTAPTLPDNTLTNLAAAVRRWWMSARILTAWDTPPHRMHAPCPECGAAGKLAALTDQVDSRGEAKPTLVAVSCVECLALWDTPELIDRLADQIYAGVGVSSAAVVSSCPESGAA
jgi:hypothetical protein